MLWGECLGHYRSADACGPHNRGCLQWRAGPGCRGTLVAPEGATCTLALHPRWHCIHVGNASTLALHPRWQCIHVGIASTLAMHPRWHCIHVGIAFILHYIHIGITSMSALHPRWHCIHVGIAFTLALHACARHRAGPSCCDAASTQRSSMHGLRFLAPVPLGHRGGAVGGMFPTLNGTL